MKTLVALKIVLELAEGNALDPDEYRDNEDLLPEARLQHRALAVIRRSVKRREQNKKK